MHLAEESADYLKIVYSPLLTLICWWIGAFSMRWDECPDNKAEH